MTILTINKSTYETMLSYCLKCRKNSESKNLKVVKNKNRRITCDSKKLKFIKDEEARGLLSSLGIRAPLS